MNKHSEWVSKESNQLILSSLKNTVLEYLAGKNEPGDPELISQAFHTEYNRLLSENRNWVEDEQSEFHLHFMALLLAGYKEILKVSTQEEALAVLKKAAIDSVKDDIQQGVRYALDYANDPMRVLVEASKEREEMFFGRTFTFARICDDEERYHLHVQKCFYHRFAVYHSVTELMNILCEWDWIWAGAIDPERHGFRFSLPTTLGYGNDVCRFYFERAGDCQSAF